MYRVLISALVLSIRLFAAPSDPDARQTINANQLIQVITAGNKLPTPTSR